MDWLIFWLIMAVAVAMIASSKGKSAGAWLVYGFLLWPIALVHILISKPETKNVETRAIDSGEAKRCPYCAELIRVEAKVCRFCGRDIPAPEPGVLAIGSRVAHPTLGIGKVTKLEGDLATVHFPSGGFGDYLASTLKIL